MTPCLPLSTARLACYSLLAALGALCLTSCFEVERRSGIEARESQLVLFEGILDPEEGLSFLPDTDGPHPGVSLEIPPGAVDEPIRVTLRAIFGDPRLPSAVQQFELTPRDLRLQRPARLALDYSLAYERSALRTWNAESVQIWRHEGDPIADASVMPALTRDVDLRQVEVSIDRFGFFYPVNPQLRTLSLQPPRLVDPAQPVPTALIDGLPIASPGGTASVRVGQGSLASLRRSGPSDNLVVVHGTLGSAVLLAGPASLAPSEPERGFNSFFRNVVAFEYPSGRAIHEMGNALYDALLEDTEPGFGCRLVAHGSGGLVARYALEHAHEDSSRPGFDEGDPPLSQFVDRAVWIGTPNAGVDLQTSPLATLLEAAAANDARFVQGLLDLEPNSPTLRGLTASPAPDGVRYHVIAGDAAGVGDDGFVRVASVLALQDLDAHQLFSGPLYDHVGLLAFADRTGVVLQTADWLAESPGPARPIVGSLEPPGPADAEGIRTLSFSLTQADAGTSLLVVEYAIAGGPFQLATPAPGSFWPPLLQGADAPGASHSIRWAAGRDLPGLLASQPVTVRITPVDALGIGIPAQTGRLRLRD